MMDVALVDDDVFGFGRWGGGKLKNEKNRYGGKFVVSM